jgi:hypothetical protein
MPDERGVEETVIQDRSTVAAGSIAEGVVGGPPPPLRSSLSPGMPRLLLPWHDVRASLMLRAGP